MQSIRQYSTKLKTSFLERNIQFVKTRTKIHKKPGLFQNRVWHEESNLVRLENLM